MNHRDISVIVACGELGTVATAETIGAVDSDIGKVIVSAKTRMTLYTFRNDAESTSNCNDGCTASGDGVGGVWDAVFN